MACSTEEPCSIFLVPFPGTLCINWFQTESIGQRWSESPEFVCWLCTACVWQGGWYNCGAEVKKEEEYFWCSSQGTSQGKDAWALRYATCPDVYTVVWAEQTWRQAVPGSSPHRQTRESIPGDAAWDTGSTSLLSPSAGMLPGLSPGTHGGPGHQAGEVLCAQGVTAVGKIFCMNN